MIIDTENGEYTLVEWPDSNRYRDYDGYIENSFMRPAGDGVFIKTSWMNMADSGKIERIDRE